MFCLAALLGTNPFTGALRNIDFHFFSNWMEYDRGYSFTFDFYQNGILLSSKSNEKVNTTKRKSIHLSLRAICILFKFRVRNKFVTWNIYVCIWIYLLRELFAANSIPLDAEKSFRNILWQLWKLEAIFYDKIGWNISY